MFEWSDISNQSIFAIITPNQWFISCSKELNEKLDKSKLFFNYEEIDDSFNVVFILSYQILNIKVQKFDNIVF